jgi:DNA-binding transcriptional LysR family regulator
MDRIDAMKVLVATLDEGSLARAGRKLGRSPAAVSRAITFLEERVGAELLHRTTRSIKLSEVGKCYSAVCRRVLTDIEDAETLAAGERSAPRGILTLAAPLLSGETALRPIVDAFMDAFPSVSTQLRLLDRTVNLIDEGIDIALQIGRLSDSTMVATRIGEVRRVVVAAPRYLAQHPHIGTPSDLASHQIVAFGDRECNSWSFPPLPGHSISRTVRFTPRLMISSVRGVVASVVDGRGVTRVLSNAIAEEVREGALEILLTDDEPAPLPVHLVSPQGRLSVPKVRAFANFSIPRLRGYFADAEKGLTDQQTSIPSCSGKMAAD